MAPMLFGENHKTEALGDAIQALIKRGILGYRLNKLGNRMYGAQNKLLTHLASGIPVDIFLTTAENWGMAFMVRTGSASFCIKVMSRLIALGHQGHAYGGVTLKNGVEVACPTEGEVFDLLGWPFVAPEARL